MEPSGTSLKVFALLLLCALYWTVYHRDANPRLVIVVTPVRLRSAGLMRSLPH